MLPTLTQVYGELEACSWNMDPSWIIAVLMPEKVESGLRQGRERNNLGSN